MLLPTSLCFAQRLLTNYGCFLAFREILENAIAPKAKRLYQQEHDDLTVLLIQKNNELKDTMKVATEQGKIDQKMKEIQSEVQKQDECIKQLQKQLKDAETVLVSQKKTSFF